MEDTRNGGHMALKCLLRDVPDRARRLRLIGEWIADNPSPYLLPMTYHADELWVDCAHCDREEFDVVMMPWVEGHTLGEYLQIYHAHSYKFSLGHFAYRFDLLADWMLSQNMAHGDLKPDNIMVRANGLLVLIDYDGFYVPALAGEQATETGTPPYRHPRRQPNNFNRYVDDFSLLLLRLEFHILAHFPDWYITYNYGDALFVRLEDVNAPRQSKLFADIYEHGKPIHRALLAEVEDALIKPLIFKVRELVKPDLNFYSGSFDLIPYRKKDKWGFSDINKRIVIDCHFDELWPFADGIARVKRGNQVFYIDKKGVILFESTYEKSFTCSRNRIRVIKNGKSGFLNKEGDLVIPCQYNCERGFEQKVTKVQNDGDKKWALLDFHGNLTTGYEFDKIDLTVGQDGLISAEVEYKHGIINIEAKHLTGIVYDHISKFRDGYSTVEIDDFNSCAYINLRGELMCEFIYDDLGECREGVIFSANKAGQIGIIEAGKSIPYKIFDRVKPGRKYRFSEPDYDKHIMHSASKLFYSKGLVNIRENSKVGFVDLDENVVIPLKYENEIEKISGWHIESTYRFSNGISEAVLGGKAGGINEYGDVIIDFKFAQVTPTEHGYVFVRHALNPYYSAFFSFDGIQISPFRKHTQSEINPYIFLKESKKEGTHYVHLNGLEYCE